MTEILSPWMLYFILILDNVKDCLFIFTIIVGVVVGSSYVSYFMIKLITIAENEQFLSATSYRWWILGNIVITGIFIVLTICYSMLPSTRQMATIYTLPIVANSKEVQNISSDGIKILSELTKQYLEKLTTEVKNNVEITK